MIITPHTIMELTQEWVLSPEQEKIFNNAIEEIDNSLSNKRRLKEYHSSKSEYIKDRINVKYKNHYSKPDRFIQKIILKELNWSKLLDDAFKDEPNVLLEIETIEREYKPTFVDSDSIRFDNLEDIAKENSHLFKDGQAVIKYPKGVRAVFINIPIGIDYHTYFPIFKKLAGQYHYLNPTHTQQDINDWLVHLFNCFVIKPYSVDITYNLEFLEEISREVIWDKVEPTTKQVKFLFNPDYELSAKDKVDLINELNGAERADKKLQTLKKFYTEGMSKNALIKISGISKPTVYKYWDSL